jgi:hypothetical protein
MRLFYKVVQLNAEGRWTNREWWVLGRRRAVRFAAKHPDRIVEGLS